MEPLWPALSLNLANQINILRFKQSKQEDLDQNNKNIVAVSNTAKCKILIFGG